MDAGDYFVIALLIGGAVWFYLHRRRKRARLAAMTPAQREAVEIAKLNKRLTRETRWATLQHGIISPEFICPHCQVKGYVHTQVVKRKKGVSGGKAAGAVITLGWSLLATGLSRKERVTEAWCGNCKTEWTL
jgi:hypothetical protein